MVPLGEIVTPAGSKAGGDVGHTVYSVTKHQGFVPSAEYFKKQVFSRELSNYKRVRPGEFAYATIHLDEGSIGIAPADGLISPMYTVFKADDDHVDSRYLLRYLKSPAAIAQYPRLGKGTVHRRKSIVLAALGQIQIPLPPLAEQRRIAAILDHADAIRAAHSNVVEKIVEIEHSMFKDFLASDSLPRKTLRDLGVDFVAGKNVVGSYGDTHPSRRVIKVSAISTGQFDANESKSMPANYDPPRSHRIRMGDILFGRASGSVNLLGVTAVVNDEPEELYLPDKVWRLVVAIPGAVTSDYVLGLLRSSDFMAFVRHNASGAAGVRNIAKSTVLNYVAPVPSLGEQRAYADQVRLIRRQGQSASRTAQQFDALFASLQSRAFRGEL